MSDRVLFVLPDTMEEALWALPPISQYLETRIVMEKPTDKRQMPRPPVGEVSAVCPLTEIHPLLRAIRPDIEITTYITPEQREMDLVFELDAKKAYELTKRLERHITESYGFLIGAVPIYELPVIAQAMVPEIPGSVLVVDRYQLDAPRDWAWNDADEFISLGQKNDIEMRRLGPDATFAEQVDAISRASIVVGVRGTGTIIATSLRKLVMELSPDGFEHKNWMAKWECKAYRMIYGDIQDMVAWFVWERLDRLVEEIHKINQEKQCGKHPSITSKAGLATVAK